MRLGGRALQRHRRSTDDCRVIAGAAAPDQFVAKAAADAGVDGLAFLRGVPGSIGGALRMNAGAHGGETKDVLIEARARRPLRRRRGFLERATWASPTGTVAAPEDVIFTRRCRCRARRATRPRSLAEMERITAAREAIQPIREKTGGSTFKNPPGRKAWQLIDAAGCRGLVVGDAQVSATCTAISLSTAAGRAPPTSKTLGEEVRRRVLETSGVMLEWEIKRIGSAGPGRSGRSACTLRTTFCQLVFRQRLSGLTRR